MNILHYKRIIGELNYPITHRNRHYRLKLAITAITVSYSTHRVHKSTFGLEENTNDSRDGIVPQDH